jgi:hypothetical protein
MSYHQGMTWRARRVLWALGISLAVVGAGCGHPVERKLQGRWIGSGVENFDDDAIAVATGWARGASLEFAGSTLTVAIPAEEPRSGPYKVVGVHQNDITLSVRRKDGSADPVRLKLDDEREIRWMVGGGRAVLMRRAE